MSVINQMLKDLDRRQQEAEGAAVYVAPVRQQGWWMLVLTLLCTLALGILGWRTWIFWQQSQRASLPAAQVEAPRTAPAVAPSAPLAVVATTQAVSSAAPMAKVPAASAESTAARVAPSAAEQAPADEAVLADEGNPEEALGDETIPSDEELQPDLYAELAAEQGAEEAPAPAAPRKPGILKIETVELSDAELATLAERKATTAMAKGRMEEAQDGYYEVLAHDPHNQRAREQLAGLLYGAGRLTEAAQVLEEGLRLDPEQADLRLLLARVAISGGDRQKALDWLTGYQPDIASNLDYYATWAGLAQELGQPVQASEMYVRLLRQQPDQGRWWLGLGVAEDGQGHRQRALDAYRNAQLHGNLGEASTQWLEQRIGQLTH
ncbi:tetratricopeptide repeat protein [Aeromonas caviae]|uniref:tetratricopeptide repeat protein n=1 Tax=Aeromonas TaxID=642 RepID=UPI001377F452|nr:MULTISPECIES: tetratricopeptide repeat protein [Aeromonas]MDU4189458.1 tetratricopeptide repeat protein [Aeromonas sp.]NBA29156.1 tetratricopeptide repeat protein [Aeromonas caviae]